MTQLEKDRLIEKFMGWKLEWTSDGLKWLDSNGKSLGKTCYPDSTLGFTADWNWLMTAFRRFDELPMASVSIGDYKKYVEMVDNLDYAITLYNIDDAVNALCEGIDWYNSIKK